MLSGLFFGALTMPTLDPLLTRIPDDADIERTMLETGMARMQAINHLRQRAYLVARRDHERREALTRALSSIGGA